MTPQLPKTTNGTFWGLSVERWASILQSFGIPTLFMFFVCYLVWTYLPPVVSAHLDLLEKQRASLQSMDETLDENCKMLRVIEQHEYPRKDFRERVYGDHDKAQQSLERIEKLVKENGGK